MATLNMYDITKSLQEMISEESPDASKHLLYGAREEVFREIFVFHYPSFLDNLHQSIPDISESEELVCMLTALRQNASEIAMLLCLSIEEVLAIYSSVFQKANELEEGADALLQKILNR